MEQNRPNFFSGPYIDRRAEVRDEAGWLDAALSDPTTLYLLGRGTTHLLRTEPDPAIAFLTREHPLIGSVDPSQFVLLGWSRDTRTVLLDIDPERPVEPPPGASFQELRALSPMLRADEAGLLAYARALSIWRARQRYCGLCGAPTVPIRAGHCMRCSSGTCGHEFFPRIDPAIIVLVTDGERALLGRQSTWPPGRYSTIAGFVEPGESLEDAVIREVREETGVLVTAARYDSSQPWPFPSSLMIGFQAKAEPGAPVVVSGELEAAGWFTRQQIESGAILVPPSHSISYRLISTWLQEPRASMSPAGSQGHR